MYSEELASNRVKALKLGSSSGSAAKSSHRTPQKPLVDIDEIKKSQTTTKKPITLEEDMFDFENNLEAAENLLAPLHIDVSRSQSQRSGFGMIYDENAVSPNRVPEFYEAALDEDLTLPLSAHEIRQLEEGEMPVESNNNSVSDKEEYK